MTLMPLVVQHLFICHSMNSIRLALGTALHGRLPASCFESVMHPDSDDGHEKYSSRRWYAIPRKSTFHYSG